MPLFRKLKHLQQDMNGDWQPVWRLLPVWVPWSDVYAMSEIKNVGGGWTWLTTGQNGHGLEVRGNYADLYRKWASRRQPFQQGPV